MSGAIAATLLPFGQVGQLGVAALSLANRYDALDAQSASGLVAPDVADLGASTGTVLDLQPQLAAYNAWSGNLTTAGNQLAVAQTALASIGSIASSLYTTLTGLSGDQGTDVTTAIATAATEASSSLGELGTLLDTQSADAYVFGGADATIPPVTNPATLGSGSLASAIGSAVAGLADNGAAGTMASILSLATTTGADQPFSASIGGANPVGQTMVIGNEESVAVGVAATSGTLASPTASSTGSPIRDLVAVLSAVASMGSSDASVSGFSDFVSALRTTTAGAVSGLSDLQGTLGATQDFVASTSTSYGALSGALTTQIGSLTSVDLASVSTQLTGTETALQASYQLIADLKGLSLASYL